MYTIQSCIVPFAHNVSLFPSSAVQIGFTPTLYEVDEDSGVVTSIVENRNPDLEREVTVQFTTTEGTASGEFCNIK